MSFGTSADSLADVPQGVQRITSFLIVSSLYGSQCCLILFFLVVIVFVPWLLWRCWAFTLIPWRYPNRPREVPYWIPFLGHTHAFLEDADGLLAYGRYVRLTQDQVEILIPRREYFKHSDEPYALHVAGEKLYVLTSPQDMKAARENTSTLSQYELTRDFIIALGLNPAVGKTVCRSSMQADKLNLMLRSGAMRKSFVPVVENLASEKQNPVLEQSLNNLHDDLVRHIDESMQWNRLSAKYTRFSNADERDISLLGWCRDSMINAATRSYFDEALLQIEPNLSQIVFDFDTETCGSIAKYPHRLGNFSSAAKQKGIAAFTAYLKLSKVQRAGEAQFVRDLEEEYRRLGLDEENLASLMMIVYWVINANTYKLTFWLLSHLVANPSLLGTVRSELSHAIPPSSPLNISSLQTCPTLIASLHETIRLTSAPCTLHRVLAPTTIGTKTLLPSRSSKILTPHRQLHLNDHVFGPDVHTFRPARFARNPRLAHCESFGGTAGMVVAEGAVLTFVALAVGRLGVEMASSGQDMGVEMKDADLERGCSNSGSQRFPRLDEKKGCLGIMGPMPGDDLFLKVTRSRCD
ncbi:hypothetical protein MMC07_004589, partial [Pseudocyphellaria aurata]|nr:hypothetical protein [Pseudocyphellaria aurata]